MSAFLQTSDTIAAIATAKGAAGVAVVRVSGPGAWDVGAQVCHLKATGPAGTFRHSRFFDGDEAFDDGLILFFRSPASYTGEDVVELQGHGGRVTSERLLAAALASRSLASSRAAPSSTASSTSPRRRP